MTVVCHCLPAENRINRITFRLNEFAFTIKTLPIHITQWRGTTIRALSLSLSTNEREKQTFSHRQTDR